MIVVVSFRHVVRIVPLSTIDFSAATARHYLAHGQLLALALVGLSPAASSYIMRFEGSETLMRPRDLVQALGVAAAVSELTGPCRSETPYLRADRNKVESTREPLERLLKILV